MPRLCRHAWFLLLAAAPLAGWWFGEGRIPLISAPASGALLLLAFGAALLAPSPRRREKYYVLAASVIMFAGAWSAGQVMDRRAVSDCLKRGEDLRAALEHYRTEQGGYPEQLKQLGVALPGRRRLHPDLLHYQPTGDGYRLYFSLDNLRFEATRHTPFAAQRQDDQ